jgi:hypothetical protein
VIDFESEVVGTMLLRAIAGDQSTARRLLVSLPADSFQLQANQEVWLAAQTLRLRSDTIDLVSVNREMREQRRELRLRVADKSEQFDPERISTACGLGADSAWLVYLCDHADIGRERHLVEQIRKASEDKRARLAEITSLIAQLSDSLGEGGFFAVLAALGRVYETLTSPPEVA